MSREGAKISYLKSIVKLLLIFVLASCGGSKTVDEKDYREFRELVSSKEFEIENQWAIPLGGGNINLIGNPNFIKFENDSVDVFLPYFGVRQSGANYGSSEGGIKYNGVLSNFQMNENSRKGSIELEFEAEEDGENYSFAIDLFPNGKARTRVISNERTSISYEGQFSRLENN